MNNHFKELLEEVNELNKMERELDRSMDYFFGKIIGFTYGLLVSGVVALVLILVMGSGV